MSAPIKSLMLTSHLSTRSCASSPTEPDNTLARVGSTSLLAGYIFSAPHTSSCQNQFQLSWPHLHWSSGHDFRLSRVKSRQARETRVRFPDGEFSFWPFRNVLSLSMGTVFAIYPFGGRKIERTCGGLWKRLLWPLVQEHQTLAMPSTPAMLY